jgi:hypothetical protein
LLLLPGRSAGCPHYGFLAQASCCALLE